MMSITIIMIFLHVGHIAKRKMEQEHGGGKKMGEKVKL